MIGNSSSGLLEMPSFKKFTINIGERQSGRIKAKTVIDCSTHFKDIIRAIQYCLDKKFKKLKKLSIHMVTVVHL